MADKEAKYSFRFDSNAAQVGAEGASALTNLRDAVTASKDAIRGYSDSLKSLKGNSDEVKKAREQLTAALKAEQAELTRNTLAIVQAGSSYNDLAKKQKNAAEQAKKQAEATSKSITAAGGPVADLKRKWSELSEALSTSEGAASLATGALVAGAAAAAVAIVALGAAIAASVAAFGVWVVTAGNVLRTQALTREAFAGNATDAEHLGNQIEALGKKVPTARAALNDMGNDLLQAGIKGSTLVDTLNAVGQTSAALNATAGNKIKDLVDRGKSAGRFALGMLDTQGTGLTFADVATALATNTKTSVQEASQALLQGQVTLGDGAAALRSATEKRFGQVNLAKLLDLDVLKQKFADTFSALTKDIKLDSLLADFQSLMSLFDSSTETGADLKQLVTWFGQGVVDTLHESTPAVKAFFERLVGAALDLEIEYLKLKLQIQQTFGKDALDRIDAFAVGAGLATVAFGGLVGGVSAAGEHIREFIRFVGEAIDAGDALYKKWQSIPWGDLGRSVLDGIVGPLSKIGNIGAGLGADMIAGLRGPQGLDAHSPSRATADATKDAIDGIVLAARAGRSDVDAAMAGVGGAMAGGAGGAASSGANAVPSVTIGPGAVILHYSGSGGRAEADDFEARVSAAMTRAVEVALRQTGFHPT